MPERFFFNKVAGLRPVTLLKKKLQHRCFPVNFAKILRVPFFYRTPPTASAAKYIPSIILGKITKSDRLPYTEMTVKDHQSSACFW